MKEPLYNVSKQIIDLVNKNGNITLFELEQTLNTSYNLIFLAIDNMVTTNQIRLDRCGKDYMLSGVRRSSTSTIEDTCINEHLCQDV